MGAVIVGALVLYYLYTHQQQPQPSATGVMSDAVLPTAAPAQLFQPAGADPYGNPQVATPVFLPLQQTILTRQAVSGGDSGNAMPTLSAPSGCSTCGGSVGAATGLKPPTGFTPVRTSPRQPVRVPTTFSTASPVSAKAPTTATKTTTVPKIYQVFGIRPQPTKVTFSQ